MPIYLLPVEGLRLESSFTVGPVLLHEKERVERRAVELLGPDAQQLFLDDQEWRVSFLEWSAAEVEAATVDAAASLVRDGLDLLRVFREATAVVRTTSFGMPGEVPSASVLYVQGGGEGPRVGWRSTGHVLGAGLGETARHSWTSSRFPDAAALIGCSDTLAGHDRLLHAIRLLSQAILDNRPAVRMLATVIAIECMLGGGGKKYELARRAAFLTCGPPTDPLCGRGRPSCHFLTTDPRAAGAVKLLKAYETDARLNTSRRCSEWLNFVDRYADRSDIAHGDPSFTASERDADRDLFWALHNLLPPAMAWMLDHPADPIEQLDRALAMLS